MQQSKRREWATWINRSLSDKWSKWMNSTHCPRDVWSRSVTKVDVPGVRQLLASRAYLNSSSQTTCCANLTCNLFSGRKICTYCGTSGAKSFTAHERSIVCSSCSHNPTTWWIPPDAFLFFFFKLFSILLLSLLFYIYQYIYIYIYPVYYYTDWDFRTFFFKFDFYMIQSCHYRIF